VTAPAREGPFVVAFAGIGGQGALTAARALGAAGHRRGIAVVVSQLHGMSQRGGSVQSFAAFGTDRVLPPETRPVDVLVGLELLEALRMAARVGPATTLLCNLSLVPPPSVSFAGASAPDLDVVVAALRSRAGRSHFLDAAALAERSGSVNAVMLGALAALPECPVPAEDLLAAILDAGRRAARDVNARAFAAGRASLG
jgi:indolepyruvate ferredoxin oxidoreductase beta subunit